jgi:hypothetical protein
MLYYSGLSSYDELSEKWAHCNSAVVGLKKSGCVEKEKFYWEKLDNLTSGHKLFSITK